MPKSLADLRARPVTERNQRAVPVCLKPELLAELQALSGRLDAFTIAGAAAADDENRQGPPLRQGQSEAPEAAEVRAEIARVLEDMADHEGEVRLRASLSDGEWRQWVDNHPPRPEGSKGHQRDMRWASGFCNVDALVDDLGKFAHSYNDEPLGDDGWTEVLDPRLGLADKSQMASAVVSMYERVADFRQWRQILSATLNKSAGSSSPSTSGSPSDD